MHGADPFAERGGADQRAPVGREVIEQRRLHGRQPHLHRLLHGACPQPHREAPDAHDADRRQRSVGATDQRVQPGPQQSVLARHEDVVVRTGVDGRQPLRRRAVVRGQQDRRPAPPAQLLAHGRRPHAGKRHGSDDGVDVSLPVLEQGRLGRASRRHGETAAGKDRRQI